MRKTTTTIAFALGLLAAAAAAQAQEYPSRTITILSNYPPAGGVDITARIVGAELQKRTGQTVVVEDKPGATGTIGAAYVAHSAADGYTILVTANPAITIMPFMTKVSYDPIKDLIPVAKVAIAPTILVVPADSPLKTLQDFVEAARDPAKKVLVGVPGVGSAGQIEFALLNHLKNTHIGTVPYRGATFIVNDVLGHQITAGAAAVPAMASQIKAGKMRALAVVAPTRSSILPDVPTVQEALGVKLDGFPTWYGFLLPGGTPRPVVDRLEKELLAIMKDPEVVKKMNTLGNDVLSVGSKQFAAENAVEIEDLKRALKETNVSIPR